MKIIIISVFSIISLFGCRFVNKKENIDKRILETLETHKKHSLPEVFNVFYFDGDCSLCIGKLKAVKDLISTQKANKLYLLALTRDTISFKYNMEKNDIKDPIFIFSSDTAIKSLNLNELLMIDKNGKILSKTKIN
jgi:hypothetical protein